MRSHPFALADAELAVQLTLGSLLDISSVFFGVADKVQIHFEPDVLLISFYGNGFGACGRLKYAAPPSPAIVELTIEIPTEMLIALDRMKFSRDVRISMLISAEARPQLDSAFLITAPNGVTFRWPLQDVPQNDTAISRLYNNFSTEFERHFRGTKPVAARSLAATLSAVIAFPISTRRESMTVFIDGGCARIFSASAGRAVQSDCLNELDAAIAQSNCRLLKHTLSTAIGNFEIKQSDEALYFVSEDWLIRCPTKLHHNTKNPFKEQFTTFYTVHTEEFRSSLNRAVGQLPADAQRARSGKLMLDLDQSPKSSSFRLQIPNIEISSDREAIINIVSQAREKNDHGNLRVISGVAFFGLIGAFKSQTIDVALADSNIVFAEKCEGFEMMTVLPLSDRRN